MTTQVGRWYRCAPCGFALWLTSASRWSSKLDDLRGWYQGYLLGCVNVVDVLELRTRSYLRLYIDRVVDALRHFATDFSTPLRAKEEDDVLLVSIASMSRDVCHHYIVCDRSV